MCGFFSSEYFGPDWTCGVLSCFAASAGLHAGVTDTGLNALASAGCGTKLTSLTLEGGWG